MFLIAPGVAQGGHLTVQHHHAILQLIIELLERVGKTPQVFRIDDSLWHKYLSQPVRLPGTGAAIAFSVTACSLTGFSRPVNEWWQMQAQFASLPAVPRQSAWVAPPR